MRRWLLLACLGVAVSLLFNRISFGQVPDPVTAAEAPQPGSGHHYIGIGEETVNPATGQLSFDLPIQTPSGRGLSFPFGITYGSPELFYIVNTGGSLSWQFRASSPYEVNGWSYKLPSYTVSARVIQYWASSCNGTGQCVWNQCDASTGHNFRGLDGTQYTLQIGNVWPDPNFPNPTCSQPSITTAKDSGGVANVGSTVYTPDGTVYSFPFIYPYSVTNGPAPVVAALATSITDRNGNQITLNGNAYKDTTGRNVVSWTGIGNNGDQVTLSGISPITVHWQNVQGTYNETGTQVAGSYTNGCSLATGGNYTVTGISEVDLPNGQKYTFTYDSTFGRINKITFPDGGYVSYVWGLASQTGNHQDPTEQYFQVYAQGYGYLGDCYMHVDRAVITNRYVSFDGVHIALSQSFSYSTNWSSPTNDFSSKSTTVVSTDAITNQQTKTIYTYLPASPDQGLYDLSGSSNGTAVPIESSVVYQDGSGNTLKTVNKTWGLSVRPHGRADHPGQRPRDDHLALLRRQRSGDRGV